MAPPDEIRPPAPAPQGGEKPDRENLLLESEKNMCFRPPTVDLTDTICPLCGHENFIGVTKCAQCGATYDDAPVGTKSADIRDWTEGLEFEHQGAPTGAASPKPPVPRAPQSFGTPLGASMAPVMPKAPGAPPLPDR